MSKQNESKVNITLGENPEFDAIALKSFEVIKNETTRLSVASNASLTFHLKREVVDRNLPLFIEIYQSVPGETVAKVCIDSEDVIEVSNQALRANSTPVNWYMQSVLLKQTGADGGVKQVHDIPPILKPTKVYSSLSGTSISAASKANRHFLTTLLRGGLCTDYVDNKMLKIEFSEKLPSSVDNPIPGNTNIHGIFFNSIVYRIHNHVPGEYVFELMHVTDSFQAGYDYLRLSMSRGVIRFHMKDKDSFTTILKHIERNSESLFFINTDHSKYRVNQPRYTVMPMLFAFNAEA